MRRILYRILKIQRRKVFDETLRVVITQFYFDEPRFFFPSSSPSLLFSYTGKHCTEIQR